MLAFLHTSPVHVATFDALLGELGPDVPLHHEVREELLARARAEGLSAALERELRACVERLVAEGACVVLCTCSTLGGLAERLEVPAVVLRVDRPMAEQAVQSGKRVLVVAALESTLDPTLELLRDAARRARRNPEVVSVVCDGAWGHFEAKDLSRYHAAIAAKIDAAAKPDDFVVLAQASMAPAAKLVRAPAPRVVSSPRLGAESALRAYRERSRCPPR